MRKPLLSLCIIVKATDDEAALLDQCLYSVKSDVDEICVTITGNNARCEEVCKKYGAQVSHFKWINDFSAARNFNFAQATGEYILWLDADDVIVNGKAARQACKVMRSSNCDGVAAWYLYAHDGFGNCTAKHKKLRLIRNDLTLWSWGTQMNEVHEDLQASRTPSLALSIEQDRKTFFMVRHCSNDERFRDSAIRNLAIAEEQVRKYPKDPRAYWNKANALIGIGGRDKDAIATFEDFVKRSSSDGEKYLALHRMAQLQFKLGDVASAKRLEWQAIDVYPHYPDAYCGLGAIYHSLRKWSHAKEFLIQGMSKEVPDDIIVYDPTDYFDSPMRLLCDCYMQMGRPFDALRVARKLVEAFPKHPYHASVVGALEKECEELEKVETALEGLKGKNLEEIRVTLDSLPDDMKCHPDVCVLRNRLFIRTERPKDEVAYYCGYTAEQWGRQSEKTGIGGSEEAVLNLSRRWAEAGKKVIVYANVGHKETVDEHGVTWRPFWMFNVRDKFDTLIVWRNPGFLEHKPDANRVLLDMHDVVNPAEFTEKRIANVDKVMLKSEFHRSLYMMIPDSKVVIVNNGVDLGRFRHREARVPRSLIYTSSADRGLEHLLDMWPKVIEAYPDATLNVYYGWGVFDSTHANNPEMMAWKEKILKKMRQPGIMNHGRVNHDEIAKAHLRASVYAYPCHFEEIDCISAKKAFAAGNVPVMTDYAVLAEYPLGKVAHKEEWDQYAEKLIDAMASEPTEIDRDAYRKFAKKWDWDLIAKKWITLM